MATKLNTRDEVIAWLDEHAPTFGTLADDEKLGLGWCPPNMRRLVTFPSGLEVSIQTRPETAGWAFCEIGFPSRDIPECSRADEVARLDWQTLAALIERETVSG